MVKELRIKVGDKVSQGSPILLLEAQEARSEAPTRPKLAGSPTAGGADASTGADVECDVVVLGAGPGRLLGGVPRRRSRAEDGAGRALPDARRRVPQRRLHPVEGAAAHRRGDRRGARRSPTHGVAFGEPKLDLAKLREFKNKVVGKLTGGLASMAKLRKVTVLTGVGSFSDPHHLVVETKEGKKTVRFAVGDHRRRLAGGEAARSCPRIRASSIRPARSS